jgi:hypothetical protein
MMAESYSHNKYLIRQKPWRGPLACRVETRLDACPWSDGGSKASVEMSLDAAGQGPAPRVSCASCT